MKPDRNEKKQKPIFTNRVILRNGKIGKDACKILADALEAVNPYSATYEQIVLQNQNLIIGHTNFNLEEIKRVFLIGFGKAAVPMAKAVIDILGSLIFQAAVITKGPKFLDENGYKNKLKVYLGSHPIPSENSVKSTKLLLNSLPELTEKDLVLVVISGGGSALFTDPVHGVTLKDIQQLTQILLKSGANINEINTLRKHLDQVKGGRLAEKLQPAQVTTLILSDVIGDRLDIIASGPTVIDPTTYQDAIDVLERYDVLNEVPVSIFEYLKNGCAGNFPETLKPESLPAGKVSNHIIGTNFHAAKAAFDSANSLGYNAILFTTAVTGLTDHVSEFIEGITLTALKYHFPVSKPACIIFGGEPTVIVQGGGLGGRNMDLALKMVPKITDYENILFISFATDGEDGPTDAAGAVADGLMFREGQEKFGLDIETYITNNDSYHYHEIMGSLIKTGATGSNVNDLMLLMIGDTS